VTDKGAIGNPPPQIPWQSHLPQGHFALQCCSAVAENQPTTKNRMNKELSNFAARLREAISSGGHCFVDAPISQGSDEGLPSKRGDAMFNQFALELFALQFKHNTACRTICEAHLLTPKVVEHWTQIPAVPTAAFKELELTCLAPQERIAAFYSSGTTEQKPSRHYHSAESLAIYEASLWPWFARHVVPALGSRVSDFGLCVLTPPPSQAPHSSLVHMFETVRQRFGASESAFVGKIATDNSWTLDFDTALAALDDNSKLKTQNPKLILGTAFLFVHLLDFLGEKNVRFDLAAGSRVMETGGYKNRSRSMPKEELHALITERLGVPRENVVCEYGMSELGSQAYDGVASRITHHASRAFHFPPWARVQIVSPETGREVADGETGLIRVFDLANVFSVMAAQTEDLGVQRGDGFELVGRAQFAEPRGCSLMTAEESALSLP
jgi:hypothetical protein